MLKKLLFPLLWFLINSVSVAQVCTWAETDSSYYSGQGVVTSEVIDHSGNLIVAFAPYDYHYRAIFIDLVKYDQNHVRLWVKRINSQALANMNIGLCTDSGNNIYVVSDYSGILKYDGVLRASNGGGNMFVFKLDSMGNFTWEKHTTGGHCWGRKISCDSQDNIYVAGNINGTANFDSVYIHSSAVCNFIVRYSNSGQLKWVKRTVSGSTSAHGLGLKTDASDNTYLGGSFMYGPTFFDSLSVNGYNNTTYQDAYLAKIDSTGRWLWAIRAGGIYQDELYNIDLDNSGNIYITGFFDSPTADFGGTVLTNASNDDYFVAKYDSSGNNIWAVRGWKNGYSETFCVNKSGNSYLASNSKYINKYDSNGNPSWSATNISVWNSAMVADDSGSVYISGTFADSADFGNYHFTTGHPGYSQVFVAKLEFPSPSISVNEIVKKESWIVYPNPSEGRVILCCRLEPKTELTLRVSSTLGKDVYSEKIKDATGTFTKELDLGAYPKGVYFIELAAPTKSFKETKKIVIQ